jgi:F-type H+-transporting ATPase subunit delta
MTGRAAARRYARALFDVVRAEADPSRVETELASVQALVSSNDALRRALTNPAIPTSRKRAVIEALLAQAGTLTPALGKLLLMLAERDRFALLPDLVGSYRDRLMDHLHIVQAEVTTAVPLPEERRATIERGLAQATSRSVTLTTRVDPAILGGAVTRVGSTVYDGSIARQLERLKEQLQTP